MIDRMREQGTEDVLHMSGIPSGEEHPLEAPRNSIRKRLPWMMANVVFNLVAVVGVAVFEDSIATTITDLTGFFLFLGMATYYLTQLS